jgi:hypothetical protein
MSNRYGRSRGALALVPDYASDPGPSVWFCSHCGVQPERSDDDSPARVCDQCGLGVLLETRADAAPQNGGAFLVLDHSLSVCAVSKGAERLLAARETDAVHRHVTELLVPADAEAAGPANLAAAVTWAAGGDDTPRTVIVRPANVFGVRLTARIASCSPPQAALLVFD